MLWNQLMKMKIQNFNQTRIKLKKDQLIQKMNKKKAIEIINNKY